MTVRSSVEKLGLRLLSLALLLAFLACLGAQAQQQPEKKKAAPAKAIVGTAPAKPVVVKRKAPPAVVVRHAWNDANFEQWVFQQDHNAAGARQRLDALLTLHVDDIDRACKLTDPQKTKLQLAARGDVKRFFDRYEAVKRKFQLVKNDEHKMQEIWQDINPLQLSLQAGLFHDDSLFYKSIRSTLSAEQAAGYEAIASERREFRHRATIELVVNTFEQNMPMRDEQRRELITRLAKLTKPSRKSGQYDYYVIMFQLARLPEEKFKPLFDELQWKAINRQRVQFKGMWQFLKQAGELPDEDDDPDKADNEPPPMRGKGGGGRILAPKAK
jgi:hypothetical protein